MLIHAVRLEWSAKDRFHHLHVAVFLTKLPNMAEVTAGLVSMTVPVMVLKALIWPDVAFLPAINTALIPLGLRECDTEVSTRPFNTPAKRIRYLEAGIASPGSFPSVCRESSYLYSLCRDSLITRCRKRWFFAKRKTYISSTEGITISTWSSLCCPKAWSQGHCRFNS